MIQKRLSMSPHWLLGFANVILIIPKSPAELSLRLQTREAVWTNKPSGPTIPLWPWQPKAQAPPDPKARLEGRKSQSNWWQASRYHTKERGFTFFFEHKMKQTKTKHQQSHKDVSERFKQWNSCREVVFFLPAEMSELHWKNCVYVVGNPGCRLKLRKTAACRHPGKLKFPATGSGPGVSVHSSRGTKVFL